MKDEMMMSQSVFSRSSKMKRLRLISVAAVLLVCCLAFVGGVGALEGDGTTNEPYLIKSEDDLFQFYELTVTHSSTDLTISFSSNIVLTKPWNPILWSASKHPSHNGLLTINGNNHHISNLSNMLLSYSGTGQTSVIINDLTIIDSKIEHDIEDVSKNTAVGAFIGEGAHSAIITLNNCHLINSKVNGGHWTGGLIGTTTGHTNNLVTITINNCSVSGCTIMGKGSVGGVIGHATQDDWVMVDIKFTTISQNSITSTGSDDNKAGSVIGTVGVAGNPQHKTDDKISGVYVSSCIINGNDVKSNNIVNKKIYGRQGNSGGRLYITSDVCITQTDGGELSVDKPTATGGSLEKFESGGDIVTITVTPNNGYELKSLSVVGQYTDNNIIVTENQFTMPYEPVIVSAHFTGIEYNISIAGGSASHTKATVNQEITLTPVEAEEGYVFKEWKVNPNTIIVTNNKFTMPASDVSIEAVFEEIQKDDEVFSSNGGSGIGGYESHPRTTINGGYVGFGYSKVITGVILPEGSSGSVVLKVDTIEGWTDIMETEYTFDISVEKLGEGMAYILFEIPLRTLENLGLTPADICAYHLVDGEWVMLKTTYEVKERTVFYEAETDSFSPFKLVFEEGAATPKAEETEPVIPPTEEPENKPEDIAPPIDEPVQPTEPETPAPLLAVLAGLGAAVVLRRK